MNAPMSRSPELAVQLDINGKTARLEVALTETLLSALRDRLQLTGAKRGCNQGVCGACTVSIDGMPMRACLSLAANCEGRQVLTIEGSGGDPLMQALQDAFVEQGALQCGFCTAGMLVTACALLKANPDPSVDEVQAGLSGNLCRCTGYRKIIEAVRLAAKRASAVTAGQVKT